jgi:hypothetical protein
MTVYLLKADYRYQGLVPPPDPAMIDVMQRFDGTPIGKSWEVVTVEVDDDEPTDLPVGDFSLLGSHLPVFSRRAVELLRKDLEQHGELLKVACDCGEYYAYNVTTLIDALNVEDSDIHYFAPGRIMRVRRYSLYLDRLQDALIFKLPQVPLLNVFVTDRFVDLIEPTGLTGFHFEPILPT